MMPGGQEPGGELGAGSHPEGSATEITIAIVIRIRF
jgi:hypothetical protein